jgi:mono/diheme cytochrome c family protein
MMRRRSLAVLAALFAVGSALAQKVPAGGDETTGRALYNAQCNGCHRAQIHWRDKKIVQDWPSLLHEVRRWQQNSGLVWSDDEILAVARHLNATWYHFPAGAGKELAQLGSEP